ncbi:hypothetical protein [Micromonospora sp. NBC_01813]|uniref:hypothetical protein n=1 Tax=Micromonospora sp. NBC_01813 TaxID=2975988 RepID=UPI002DDB1A82|nr:hypothetical protein [Micromonospora sp. NBC_01813]WSA11991.1 hypothetical protein OG958_15100 [Micromonospora sp. NBC_01813]
MATAATTLVAWATTQIAQSGQRAMSALIDFLQDRFRHEPENREIIERVLQQPAQDNAGFLAELLEGEALRDPAFAAEFRARWEQTALAVTAEAGGVANSISGDVSGPVVQARDVHGGISFGGGAAAPQ